MGLTDLVPILIYVLMFEMTSISEIDFTSIELMIIFLLISGIVFLRFLLVSGAYHFIFFTLLKKRFANRILNHKRIQRKQLLRELTYAFYGAWIFGGIGIITLYLWQKGILEIYEPLSLFPFWYIPISILLFLVLHDTYYYWMHRWMHHNNWLWKVHTAHHRSTTTGVLTAFSFHPIESILQAIFLPLFLWVVPMSIFGLFMILFIMTISATINHAGVEIYPKNRWMASFSKCVIGATHHDLHHKYSKKNYGLYFTFWDKIGGTESTDVLKAPKSSNVKFKKLEKASGENSDF